MWDTKEVAEGFFSEERRQRVTGLYGVAPRLVGPPALATTAPTGTGVCGGTKVRPALISLATDGDAFLAGYRAPGHVPYSRKA